MKPVFQTKKHNPPESYGNCFASCFASILEVPIEDVPPIERLPGFNGEGSDLYNLVLHMWLKAKGFIALCYEVPNGIPHRKAPGGYSIATGKSPRGNWLHSVVCLDGQQVHDPAVLCCLSWRIVQLGMMFSQWIRGLNR